MVRSVAYVTRPWRRLVLLPADVASQAMWTASMQHAVATAAPVSAAARYITTRDHHLSHPLSQRGVPDVR